MIQVILRLRGSSDRTVMMPQVPQQGERLAHYEDLRNTIVYRVENVIWIVPSDDGTEACKAIVEISY